jgi:large subunit ribosomal protein L46
LATDVGTSSTTEAVSSSIDSIPPRKPQRPRINVAIILNRSPLITRTPSVFERAYYAYQARIRRALHNPFQYDFYFKQGSPLEIQFNSEERKRERKAFGAPFGEVEENLDQVEKDENVGIMVDSQADQREGAGEKIMPRRHKADEQNDVRSLDREGQRNLYLLLLQKNPTKQLWRFPQGIVEKGQVLHHVRMKFQLHCMAFD